jgi:hypothetical protein
MNGTLRSIFLVATSLPSTFSTPVPPRPRPLTLLNASVPVPMFQIHQVPDEHGSALEQVGAVAGEPTPWVISIPSVPLVGSRVISKPSVNLVAFRHWLSPRSAALLAHAHARPRVLEFRLANAFALRCLVSKASWRTSRVQSLAHGQLFQERGQGVADGLDRIGVVRLGRRPFYLEVGPLTHHASPFDVGIANEFF